MNFHGDSQPYNGSNTIFKVLDFVPADKKKYIKELVTELTVDSIFFIYLFKFRFYEGLKF